jgi:uncharacterized glyoxalase superfamily protein PhnB
MPAQNIEQELRELFEQQTEAITYLQKLAGQVLTYAQQQQQQAQALEKKLNHQIVNLGQTAQSMADSGQRLVSETVQGIAIGSRQAIVNGVQSELQKIREAAGEFTGKTQEACSAMDEVRHGMVWKLSIPLLAGTLLCVLGSGAWLWWSLDRAKQAQVSAEFVSAINHADIQVCDGRLCVNTDRREKRQISGKTYYLAAPREAAPAP